MIKFNRSILIKVYTWLNKLGICISHKTSNIVIWKLGEKHDQKVRDWMVTCKFTICSQKGVAPLQDGQPEQQLQSNLGQRQAGGDQEEQPESFQSQDMQQQVIAIPSQCYDVIFQGDNVDKNVYVRDMRVDNQSTSLHYFNTYAVKERAPCSSTHDLTRVGASCYEIDGAKIPKDLRNASC